MSTDPTKVTQLYAQIPLEAMQQVNDSYMAWYVDRVTRELDETIAGLRTELRENDAHEASFRPSPSELNAIERLQRAGVVNIDLLDRMVDQGEEWLTLTMHRLDHFERTGLAPKDYSMWCEHALSGAYDWIDHERLAAAPRANTPSAPTSAAAAPPNPTPAAGQTAQQPGRAPDWLTGGGRAPNTGEERPTQPVPSVAPRWGETSYPGTSSSSPAGAPGGPTPTDPGNESGRRNIFRIFTN
jgi:hypothetical protein